MVFVIFATFAPAGADEVPESDMRTALDPLRTKARGSLVFFSFSCFCAVDHKMFCNKTKHEVSLIALKRIKE